jgi:hypothetical protein
MKNYFTHMMSKTPHERRRHAMQVAGLATCLVFLVWITTLGMRFASTPPQTASTDDPSQLAAVAASAAADSGQATLIVATSTSSGQASNSSNYNNSPQQ